jgi:hypothetical protein
MKVQVKIRKKESNDRKSELKPEDIRPLIVTAQDGTIQIEIVNLSGQSSDTYRYSSRSGKLEKNGTCPVEWIGGINISPNFTHRAWATMANLFESFKIPIEPKELKQFIKARGKEKSFYRVKVGNKVGSIYLPNLLVLAEGVYASTEKDEGFISNVMVAPHRQGQGFGLLLHRLAASYLKGLGYKKMTSDVVGMNTDGEVAVWRALKKELRVTPFKENFSMTRLLRRLNVIDGVMFDVIQKKWGTHVNGVLMIDKEISKKKFQQFELDLTDKRIPILEKEAKAA